MVKNIDIAFRVDASIHIGTGHVVRSLTLAHELVSLNLSIAFICRDLKGNLIDLIKAQNFECLLLPAPLEEADHLTPVLEESFLEVNPNSDALQTISLVKEYNIRSIIIDHYGIDSNWHRMIRPFVENIFVIDDLANRPLDCDILLDQNLYANKNTRYKKLVPKTCITLTGPAYALLRSEFFAARELTLNRSLTSNSIKIFVFFGGIDFTNETQKFIDAFIQKNNKALFAEIIVGKSNKNLSNIKKSISENFNISLHIQTQNIAKIMASADVAIGAGGSTNWERLYMGLFTYVCTIAKNQEELSLDLNDMGLIKLIGNTSTTTPDSYLKVLNEIEENMPLIYSKKERLMSIVDGTGAKKVALEIFKKLKSKR